MTNLKPLPPDERQDLYGWVPYRADSRKPPLRLTIDVDYGDKPNTDIVLDRNGKVLRHPYGGVGRMSTEEERAAVGWTW